MDLEQAKEILAAKERVEKLQAEAAEIVAKAEANDSVEEATE